VANNTPDSTSVSTQQFTQHIKYLKLNKMHVIPLTSLLKSLKAGEELPEHTVIITFDDGYKDLKQYALPLLKKEGFPFSIFINSEAIDKKYNSQMSWQDLRETLTYGGEIFNHSVSHTHMVRRLPSESKSQWQTRMTHEIEFAQQRLEKEVGSTQKVFAYPYGEFDFDVMNIIRKLGYTALGQQSGAVDAYSDFTALPRFPIMSKYAEMGAFILRLNSRPLPVSPSDNLDHLLLASNLKPTLLLHLSEGEYDQKQLQCFLGDVPLPIQWQNSEHTSFEITSPISLSPGRNKYTCTAPSSTTQDVYYWYSHLWMLPNIDASWPAD